MKTGRGSLQASRLWWTLRCAGLALFLGATLGAIAAERAVAIDVPAGEAEAMLRRFARQAQVQLIFDPQAVADLRTNAVRGRHPPAEALRQMLAGLPLVWVVDPATGAFAIRKKSEKEITESESRRVLQGAPGQSGSGPPNPQATMPSASKTSATSRSRWARLFAVVALLIGESADAQTPNADGKSAAKPAAQETYKLDTFVVTGVSYAQSQFQSSFAISSMPSREIQKLAPQNLANLLGQVPGIFTEATGGEIQNVIRLRGIPNESSFQAFQLDGLPIYPDEGFFFKGDGLIRPDLMTSSVEIVRGGPAPIFASNAAAIYNTVTRQGTELSDSAVKLTLGDTQLYRVDGFWSGKIANKTYLAAGGFLRRNDGVRYSGFPSDRGGQIQVNLRREIPDGEVKLSFFGVSDRNVFYLPIPISDPRNPSVSLNPFIDYHTGTLNTPALQSALFLYPNEAGGVSSQTRDLSDGRNMRFGTATLDFRRDAGDWHFTNKFRATDLKLDFDALYSTSNPADATTFAAGFFNAANTAFGGTTPVHHLGYAIAGSSGAQTYNPAAASGLVIQAQYRSVAVESQALQNEFRVGRDFEAAGEHKAVFGLYATEYITTELSRYQDYLFELASNPRPIDLVAYSATNQVLGSVTDRGVLRYSNTLNGGHSDFKEIALFFADSWKLSSHLTVDYGLRRERYSATGYTRLTKASPMSLPGSLAGSNAVAFTGTNVRVRYRADVTPWTIGANYDFNRRFGVYARASRSFRVAAEGNVINNSLPATTRATQYEIGAKINRRNFSAFLTAFYTDFNPYVQTFQAVNPTNGTTANLNFTGKATTPGIEADISWKPFKHLTIDGAITYNKPRGGDYLNSLGADASAAEDKQLVRTPDVFGNIRPSVDFKFGDWDMRADLRYNYVGKRYVDIKNLTELPAYKTYTLGLMAERGGWSFYLSVDNLTNAKGLTEGNPRSDVIAGQGTATAVYGRPLMGRSVRLETTYKF